MYGPEMYDLARRLSRERQRIGERMASESRRSRGPSRSPEEPSLGEGRWTLEWAHNGFTGARVTLRNEATGQRLTGRHPYDWDRALGDALG